MIFRRLEGELIRTGINWNLSRGFQIILDTPWFRTQYRYRSFAPSIKEFYLK